MIISDKQHQANRQNATHSTGPQTPEGKEAIRFNALTYGLRTKATILPEENFEDYSQLWDDLQAQFQPKTRIEMCYLETMATSQWLLARVAESEKKIYMFMEFGEPQFIMLGHVAKQRAQLERSFRTAVADMQKAQSGAGAPACQPQPQTQSEAAASANPPARSAPQAPPDYAMSGGGDTHPVSCAPVANDTR